MLIMYIFNNSFKIYGVKVDRSGRRKREIIIVVGGFNILC